MVAQPALHDLVTVLRAPSLALSSLDGQIRRDGAQGWYLRDRRVLDRLEISVVEGQCDAVGWWTEGASAAVFHSAVTGVASDPTIMVSRRRVVSVDGLTEHLDVVNHGASAVPLTVGLRVGACIDGIDAVRSGRADKTASDEDLELIWEVELEVGQTWSLDFTISGGPEDVAGFTPTPAPRKPRWALPDSLGDLRDVVHANLADVEALLLGDPSSPDDVFAAAGAPWYLTLFGRDALWTAHLLLPLGTELAAGTLRTLARRQGTAHDPESEEAPGKILHEARSEPMRLVGMSLPVVYFGTIDATALWVCLLHDAWRAGMPDGEVAALLPNLVAAMGWITGQDGFLVYAGASDSGLANQGWKDSADAIRHLDGRRAVGPVALVGVGPGFSGPELALCEVQGYAHAAAVGAAAVASAFDLPGGEIWLTWARRLRSRFHDAFWLHDAQGAYPAIAIDGHGEPVSGATSNIAHLLGTGLLDADQAGVVAARLAQPDLTTDYGLRTLTSTSAAYNPVSYHCGSVWPHDTAIAITGLAAEGHPALATTLASGLIRAARHFAGRPPELYGVLDAGPPIHYPTACRPQAWSAAAVIAAALHLTSARG